MQILQWDRRSCFSTNRWIMST